MTIDEPISHGVEEWTKKALWQSRNDQDQAIKTLSDMLKSHSELRNEIAGLLVRSTVREMLWSDKPMG